MLAIIDEASVKYSSDIGFLRRISDQKIYALIFYFIYVIFEFSKVIFVFEFLRLCKEMQTYAIMATECKMNVPQL